MQLYEKIRRSEQKYRVALEVLSYHSQSSDDEFQNVKDIGVPDKIVNITQYVQDMGVPEKIVNITQYVQDMGVPDKIVDIKQYVQDKIVNITQYV